MRPKIQGRLVSLVAAGIIGAPLTAGAQARPVHPHVDYRGISFTRLMAIYKQAYEDAGFTFRSESTEGGRKSGKLVFHIAITELTGAPQITERFSVIPTLDDHGNCSPCSISRDMHGLGYGDYGTDETTIANKFIDAADARAVAKIRWQLGQSLRSSEDPPMTGPLPDC